MGLSDFEFASRAGNPKRFNASVLVLGKQDDEEEKDDWVGSDLRMGSSDGSKEALGFGRLRLSSSVLDGFELDPKDAS